MNALIIPKRAVQTVRNRAYVDVLQPDGSKETVRVVLGPDDGVNQVVLEGLRPRQQVVLPSRVPTRSSNPSSPGGLRLPIGGGRWRWSPSTRCARCTKRGFAGDPPG